MTVAKRFVQTQADTLCTNWAGNHTFVAAELLQPASVEEIQDIVRSRARIKPLGAGHSFNAIADTPGTQLSLRRFTDKAIDREAQTVTVGAGVTYGELAPWLDAQGFALHNLASLPHISVAGACATERTAQACTTAAFRPQWPRLSL